MESEIKVLTLKLVDTHVPTHARTHTHAVRLSK